MCSSASIAASRVSVGSRPETSQGFQGPDVIVEDEDWIKIPTLTSQNKSDVGIGTNSAPLGWSTRRSFPCIITVFEPS